MDNFQIDIVDRLGRIETKLDVVCKNTGDQEQRLRSLEKYRWIAVGIILTISATVSTIITIIIRG